MTRRRKPDLVVEWLFERMICFLAYGDWEVKIYDFKNSKCRRERKTVGLTDFDKETIYLDKTDGGSDVLIHELGHIFFQDLLDNEVRNMPKRLLKPHKNFDRWVEFRILEWEAAFFKRLSKKQVGILEFFIKNAGIAQSL